MKIYATRRECEIILNCLYSRMGNLKMDEMPEYNKIANRIIEVTNKQCKADHSSYSDGEED